MSHLCGDLIQLGYVVPDLQAAMAHWQMHLGVSTWFLLPHLAVQGFTYSSKPSPVDISLALSYSGSVQIELIQQHNEAPSLYQDFLMRQPHGGLHHLGYGTDAFETTVARVQDAGPVLVQYGVTGSRGPFAYFLTDDSALGYYPGTCIEVIDLAHGRAELFAAIHAACDMWDGHTDSVRTQLPAYEVRRHE